MTDPASEASSDNQPTDDVKSVNSTEAAESTSETAEVAETTPPATDSTAPNVEAKEAVKPDETSPELVATPESEETSSVPAKPKTPIGTQRDGAQEVLPPRGPVVPKNPKLRKAKPKPITLSEIPKTQDDELEAMMGEFSMDNLMQGNDELSGEQLAPETKRPAKVVRLHGENVFFDVGARQEGVASKKQFDELPEVGAEMEVTIIRFSGDDGLYEVAIPGASVAVADWGDIAEGQVVEARITGHNTGGLECAVNSIRGFIPASQISLYRVEDFSEFVDKRLTCVVNEANPSKNNLILSHRAFLEREREAKREEQMKTIEVGQLHDGIVANIKEFGAFVDLGGLEGLVHISKMSWERIKHPSEVLEVGQKIQVKVDKVDKDTGRIGLSYRDTLEDPWAKIDQTFPEGTIVSGTVTRVAEFGAFIKIAPGIEGLAHISELAHRRVLRVNTVVKVGDVTDVKVLSIDPDAQKISLSIKACGPEPEKKVTKRPEDEIDDTPREPVIKGTDEPLKGGRDQKSGGEQFGLNW